MYLITLESLWTCWIGWSPGGTPTRPGVALATPEIGLTPLSLLSMQLRKNSVYRWLGVMGSGTEFCCWQWERGFFWRHSLSHQDDSTEMWKHSLILNSMLSWLYFAEMQFQCRVGFTDFSLTLLTEFCTSMLVLTENTFVYFWPFGIKNFSPDSRSIRSLRYIFWVWFVELGLW